MTSCILVLAIFSCVNTDQSVIVSGDLVPIHRDMQANSYVNSIISPANSSLRESVISPNTVPVVPRFIPAPSVVPASELIRIHNLSH